MIKEDKFTQGPWHILKGPSTVFITDEDISDFRVVMHNPIAIVSDRLEIEANSELIASAPDLLRENRELKKKINELTENRDYIWKERKEAKQKLFALEGENERLRDAIERAIMFLEMGFGSITAEEILKEALGEGDEHL